RSRRVDPPRPRRSRTRQRAGPGRPPPRRGAVQLGQRRRADRAGLRRRHRRVPRQLVLDTLRGFVFDLDGCVWTGEVLSPGARDTLAALHAAGRRLAFISNNSRATGSELRDRLRDLGVSVAEHVLTPLDIIGRVIAEARGRSRVLVMGADTLARAVAAAGHE